MIKTPEQAIAFVRRHGVVTMTHHARRPSFVEAVAGVRVRGSWWGHAQGGRIYELAGSLHDSDEILSLKLLEGKVTFVHQALWPALARVVTDPGHRKSVRLSPEARRLLRLVERRKSVRLDRVTRDGRRELEAALLVHSGSVHTEKGAHATVLTTWTRIFDDRTLSLARQMTSREAKSLLGL